MKLFEPQPGELPGKFPSPFASEPHALARRAAEELVREVGEPAEGKMFGVLVVADDLGRIGYLRAFSGMFGGTWHVPGFAPPVFDEPARASFWPAGEASLATIDSELAALEAAAAPALAALAALDARHASELDEMRTRHRQRRRLRHQARDAFPILNLPGTLSRSSTSVDVEDRESVPSKLTISKASLDRESRVDGAERRRLDARHVEERAALAERVAEQGRAIGEMSARRAERSRELLVRIHGTYVLENAAGERKTLRELFAPAEPPGGAGDCAAPKLLAQAYRERLRPLALAEVWLGPPPATGGRHAGVFYPACRGKCGPILAHMLRGLPAEPVPEFGNARVPTHEPRTIFEDEHLVVVAKPAGLLSVPGRGGALRDSVLARLRARYPDASGPLLVHRLDLDASGLLLCAKDSGTHAALQRLFALRDITKRYIAWLDGEVARDAGTVELPLRVDLDDRPRQIFDPIHGKPATTEWRVVDRAGARTRVELSPLTGRAHQLRVHASHPRGIGAPIVGDRLYGRAGERLLLHAAHLAFIHPHTGARVVFDDPPPF